MYLHVLTQLQPFRSVDGHRLGLPQIPKTTFSDVPFPVELHLPGVCVVSLAMTEMSVHIPFILSTNILISYYSCILTGVSMHLVLMVVCMSGVGAFDLFYFTLKYPDADNGS